METKASSESGVTVEGVIDNTVKVGNDGFIRLVDSMGDDSSIVQAARVSYGAGTKTVREDEKLIEYLYKHKHTTPFEMVEFKFHIRVEMDTWRQWIRHRTASVNEYSTRYSVAIDSNKKAEHWRRQSKKNKQGSSDEDITWPDGWTVLNVKGQWFLANENSTVLWTSDTVITPQTYLTHREEELHRLAREVYLERLRFDVAREQARKDLLLSNYTEAYWKIDLHNLIHFLKLRLDQKAQAEIRDYALAILSLIRPIVPTCYSLLIREVT